MPSTSDVTRLRDANARLADLVIRDLVAFWASLDLTKPERARDALLEFVPVLTTLYGEAAATVAADWYDEMRAAAGVSGRFMASMAPVMPAEYVQARVKYGAGHLFTNAPEAMLPFLQGVVQKYVLQPGRDTIQQSAIEDPRASGWHREVRADGCRFCRMLAGRGGVYKKANAAFAAHANCNCVAVASWDANAEEVPVSAYVASERLQKVRNRAAAGDAKAKRVLQSHRDRVREYMDTMDD